MGNIMKIYSELNYSIIDKPDFNSYIINDINEEFTLITEQPKKTDTINKINYQENIDDSCYNILSFNKQFGSKYKYNKLIKKHDILIERYEKLKKEHEYLLNKKDL